MCRAHPLLRTQLTGCPVCPPWVFHLLGGCSCHFLSFLEAAHPPGTLLAGRLMHMAGFPEAAPKARSVERNQWLSFLWACSDVAQRTEIWRGFQRRLPAWLQLDGRASFGLTSSHWAPSGTTLLWRRGSCCQLGATASGHLFPTDFLKNYQV